MSERTSFADARLEAVTQDARSQELATAERLHAWAQFHVGLAPETTGFEARRKLAASLLEVDFEPSPHWAAAARFAAADQPVIVEPLQHPLGFTVVRDAVVADHCAAELHRIWMLKRAEQLQVLTAFEAMLSPVAYARFAPVLNVLKAKSQLPIKCKVTRALVDDAVSIALAPAKERLARRRELIQSRSGLMRRRKAARVISHHELLAAIDPAYFAAVSGVRRNVFAGLAPAQRPQSFLSRLALKAFLCWMGLIFVLFVWNQGQRALQAWRAAPIELASNGQLFQLDQEQVQHDKAARTLAARISSETEVELELLPPSPSLVIQSSHFFSRDECEKLLRVYSRLNKTDYGDAIRLLNQRVWEFDAANRFALDVHERTAPFNQPVSENESLAPALPDDFVDVAERPPKQSTGPVTILRDLPEVTIPEPERPRSLSEIATASRGNQDLLPVARQFVDDNSPPLTVVSVPRPKFGDADFVEFRPIRTPADIRALAPKLSRSAKQKLLSELEEMKRTAPTRWHEIFPVICELEADLEGKSVRN